MTAGTHASYIRCGCNPAFAEDCDRCSGVAEDAYAERRAHRAPAGRPLSAVEVWRLVEACRPNTTPTRQESAA